MLYVCATPIGNLGDVSERLKDTLCQCEYVICEDSRRASKLISSMGKSGKKIIVNNEFNEKKALPGIARVIAETDAVLITDAGMPGISDPGFIVLREAIRKGIEFSVVPGPSAVLTSIVASGFPCERFCFEGFLPKTKAKRIKALRKLDKEKTTVFFESPYRIRKALVDMADAIPERQVALCRELTKRFEEVIRGMPKGIIEQIDSKKQPLKGEISLVIAPEGFSF
ncbi:MAG TPA: 16S rRNA (cytidine(1402)-2'-O)-methyltransferase [Candidatus Woesearchaeota archaeon]|nr:16S rRNA (cytidine(1402)-2'-O)-methyltransferase [Candidatus Woesearchaeota archaeon]